MMTTMKAASLLLSALLVAGCASQPTADELLAKQTAETNAEIAQNKAHCAKEPMAIECQPVGIPTEAELKEREREDEIDDLRNQVNELRIDSETEQGEDYPPPVW
jgi:outer membrane murein-binding lipoprotein Lpp